MTDVFVRTYGGSLGFVMQDPAASGSWYATAHVVMECMRCTLMTLLEEVKLRFKPRTTDGGGSRQQYLVPASVRGVLAMKLVVVMEQLERQRITHGDIKFDNILVSGELSSTGRPEHMLDFVHVKLADFGLARVYADEPSAVAGRTILTGLLAPHQLKLWKWSFMRATYHPLRLTVWAGPSVDQFSILVLLLDLLFTDGSVASSFRSKGVCLHPPITISSVIIV
jgi:serine/threonine protein kinase